jgi:signal transduction histidine kinase
MTKDKILVVDDSSDNLFLIDTILQEEGHEILLAQDGFTALEIVRQSFPQLILLDVMMPKMNGFEVTKQIREDKNIPFIPILLITAYEHPSVVTALDIGADDFIRKPVDIDELLARVRSLLRLKHSVDERDRMARMREDFVSRLTHDLRTPLIAADRMLGLMKEEVLGELSPAMAEAIDVMIHSNHNLLEMVNTLLEVYRYEADRKTLNFASIDLPELVREVVRELSPLAEEKGLELRFESEKQANSELDWGQIRGDRLELRRVFTNLVGNAIKFTDSGVIDIRLAEDRDKSYLIFSVRDTGPGISPQEQKWLFHRFRHGSHRRSGTGLGLHLSRQIVEKHQGAITVESELGKGSLFVVRLPLRS